MMSETDKQILQENRVHIRELLDVNDVLDHLKERKIVTPKDADILHKNLSRAPDLLVDLLFQNNTSSALIEFTTALKKADCYDTLLRKLGQGDTGSDSEDDSSEEKETALSLKSENYYKNRIRQQRKRIERQNAEIKQLKEELAKEREHKENTQKEVNELVKIGGQKDRKIKQLKCQLKEHEDRIKYLEERLEKVQAFEERVTKERKDAEERFANHDEQLRHLRDHNDEEIRLLRGQMQHLLDARPVHVGNVGTAIHQMHVHNNPEELSDPSFSTPPSAQPTYTEDRAYLTSRDIPHLNKTRTPTPMTPRTPRNSTSPSKTKRGKLPS